MNTVPVVKCTIIIKTIIIMHYPIIGKQPVLESLSQCAKLVGVSKQG